MQASAMRSQMALALVPCSSESLPPACMPGMLAPHQRGYSRSSARRRFDGTARELLALRENKAVGHEFGMDPARIFQRQRGQPDALRRYAVGDDLGSDAHDRARSSMIPPFLSMGSGLDICHISSIETHYGGVMLEMSV